MVLYHSCFLRTQKWTTLSKAWKDFESEVTEGITRGHLSQLVQPILLLWNFCISPCTESWFPPSTVWCGHFCFNNVMTNWWFAPLYFLHRGRAKEHLKELNFQNSPSTNQGKDDIRTARDLNPGTSLVFVNGSCLRRLQREAFKMWTEEV